MLNQEKNKESGGARRLTAQEFGEFFTKAEELKFNLSEMVRREEWFVTIDRKKGEEIGRIWVYDEGSKLIFLKITKRLEVVWNEEISRLRRGWD